MIDIVPQEIRRIVNPQQGKCSFPQTNKQSKPQKGKQGGIPKKGISGNCQSQRKSEPAQNRKNYEVPLVRFQRRSELAPKGVNSKAPAKTKRDPREGISGDFHSQERSKLARKGNKFRGASGTISTLCTIST